MANALEWIQEHVTPCHRCYAGHEPDMTRWTRPSDAVIAAVDLVDTYIAIEQTRITAENRTATENEQARVDKLPRHRWRLRYKLGNAFTHRTPIDCWALDVDGWHAELTNEGIKHGNVIEVIERATEPTPTGPMSMPCICVREAIIEVTDEWIDASRALPEYYSRAQATYQQIPT